MDEEYREGISETLDVLAHMDEKDVCKISKNFMDFLNENRSEKYIPNLDHSKKLSEMNLKEKTKDILGIIYMEFWCDPIEKKKYQKLLLENEKKHQEEMRKKYNPDNIFKNNIENNVNGTNKTAVEVGVPKEELVNIKEGFLTKIINRIRKFFKLD